MSREPSQRRQSLGALKVAAIIGLGCLVCSAERANDLFEALETDDIARIHALIGAGADVNVKNENGATPLFVAAQEGHTEIVQLLLAAGAGADARAHVGGRDHTPLSIARRMGHSGIVSS